MLRSLLAVSVLAAAGAQAQTCPTIEPLRSGYGLNGPGRHSAVYDEDGAGPNSARLFLAGEFTSAAGIAADGLVRWDGDAFSAVAGAPAGPKGTMRVFSDGAGLAMFMAGGPGILHRYDGANWSIVAVPQFGGHDGVVESTTVFDPDGSGPQGLMLHALVRYSGLAAESDSVLYRYTGAWTRISGAVPRGGIVAFDRDGPGGAPTDLIHYFTVARTGPDRTVTFVRRLRPASWELLGYGVIRSILPPPHAWRGIVAAAEHDVDASGPAQPKLVFTGDIFESFYPAAGGVIFGRSALAWDGTNWVGSASLGSGGNFRGASLLSFREAGVSRLYAGAMYHWFSYAASRPPAGLLVADSLESNFTFSKFELFSLSSGPEGVTVLKQFDPDGAGPLPSQLVVSGDLEMVMDQPVEHFAAYEPSTGLWKAVQPNPAGSFASVRAFEVFNDGSGRKLFAAGQFRLIGQSEMGSIARWDGASWQALGAGVRRDNGGEGQINALAAHNDGSGWALYAAGTFATAGGVPVSNIARWNGQSWSGVGEGLPANVNFLALFDPDGSGPLGRQLYASTAVPSVLKRWDGASWIDAPPAPVFTQITALKTLNDGSGPALYIGYDYKSFPLYNAYIARITPAGTEILFETGQQVYDYALQNIAGGWRLVVAMGSDIFRVDSGALVQLGAPERARYGPLRAIDDGAGSSLYSGAYRLTGSGWEPLTPAPELNLRGLPIIAISPVWDDGAGASVFLGGDFRRLGNEGDGFIGAGRIARVRTCAGPLQQPGGCYANCDGSDASPVLNAGDVACFLQFFAAGDDRANCDGSRELPRVNVQDLTCFMQHFAAGCGANTAER